jgi:hypothetical protein
MRDPADGYWARQPLDFLTALLRHPAPREAVRINHAPALIANSIQHEAFSNLLHMGDSNAKLL